MTTATKLEYLQPQQPDVKLMRKEEVAARLMVSISTLERWRSKGGGPAYIKMGKRRVAYSEAAIEAWLLANEYTSTKDAKRS